MKQRPISHFSNEGLISLQSLRVRSNPSLLMADPSFLSIRHEVKTANNTGEYTDVTT